VFCTIIRTKKHVGTLEDVRVLTSGAILRPLAIMDSRNGCALLLFLIIVLCAIMVNTPPLTQQDREAIRAYEARKKIEGSLDVLNELAKMEGGRSSAVRYMLPDAPAAYQPAPSLPPSVLSR